MEGTPHKAYQSTEEKGQQHIKQTRVQNRALGHPPATPHGADQSAEDRGHLQTTQLEDDNIKQRMMVTCMYY